MVAALITVDAVVGSDDDRTVGALVTLANVADGDESTYQWDILSQPPGGTDVLSSGSALSPTFTPTKAGSYLIRLIVDAALATRRENRVIVAVRHQRSGLRAPALGEGTEVQNTGSDSPGWRKSLCDLYALADRTFGDTGRVLVKVSGTVSPNSVVALQGRFTGANQYEVLPLTNNGLVPVVAPVTATEDTTKLLVGVVEDVVQANSAPMNANGPWADPFAVVRFFGRPERFLNSMSNIPAEDGATPDAELVFLSDTGTVSRTPGTYRRALGYLLSESAASYPNTYFLVGGMTDTSEPTDRARRFTPTAPVTTTDATPTVLASFNTPKDGLVAFAVTVSVVQSDLSRTCSWDYKVTCTNNGGFLTVHDNLTLGPSDGGAGGTLSLAGAAVGFSASAGSLIVTGTGIAATNLRWSVKPDYHFVEV